MLTFWDSLSKPIIGLSPMDGVTDRAMRHIQTTVSKPDVIFTEQINVETIVRAPEKVKDRLRFTKAERPIVAQLSGYNPNDFKEAVEYVLDLEFDGIDINLGCPYHPFDKHGQRRGAGLIGECETVEKIISCIHDSNHGSKIGRAELSVKTRLAETPQKTKEWLSFLSTLPLDAITLHGRTLKQGYRGEADWEEIGKMTSIAHRGGKILLGNGDVKSRRDGEKKCQQYGCDGVLIGRAALGNPWVFSDIRPTVSDCLSVMLAHARYFDKTRGDQAFLCLRKHLAWYARDFAGAKELRSKLIRVSSLRELEETITPVVTA